MYLTIAPSKRSFLLGSRPFFYLADTVWMAFTHASQAEWREYLSYRRRQRFNALQISVLPVLHDMSASPLDLAPFGTDEHGNWDFYRPVPAYFERAATMLQEAQEHGFVPVLVVLWCNYVPGTWAALKRPQMTMPRDAIPSYVRCVVDAFGPYDPIFAISGDTDFATPETIAHYLTTLQAIKERCPLALTTLHLAPQTDWPEAFVRWPQLDFYMCQSGHHIEEQSRAYTLAEHFAGQTVRRPVVNGEPCYEGHGHARRYGRFSAFDVRKAIWQSLLSGAGAGVAYGAHGMWSFHQQGAAFTNEAFSMTPFTWRQALHFPGAWDAGFARSLVEQYNLFDLEPWPRGHMGDASPEVRAAATADHGRLAIYVPYPTDVRLHGDVSGYVWSVVDLSTRRLENVVVRRGDGHIVIPMHESNTDVVVIGLRR